MDHLQLMYRQSLTCEPFMARNLREHRISGSGAYVQEKTETATPYFQNSSFHIKFSSCPN